MTPKKNLKKIKLSKFKIASGLSLLLVLGLSVIGIQNRLSTSGKATSGCAIVQTDQGPGCWCTDGGWQFHCGNGLVRNDPPSAECQNDCNNLNGNPPDEDKTPTCQTKGDFRCRGGLIWWCNNSNQWEKGTRSCDSNSCYPGNPTSRGCVDKSRGQKCLDNPPGYCTKTTNKNGFILCSCYTGPSPTIIKSPTPSPRGSATSTPRPSSHPTNTPVPSMTPRPTSTPRPSSVPTNVPTPIPSPTPVSVATGCEISMTVDGPLDGAVFNSSDNIEFGLTAKIGWVWSKCAGDYGALYINNALVAQDQSVLSDFVYINYKKKFSKGDYTWSFVARNKFFKEESDERKFTVK